MIGTREAPSTNSAFCSNVFDVVAGLAFVVLVLVAVDEDGEHAASAIPMHS
jgi:hypothetical protein